MTKQMLHNCNITTQPTKWKGRGIYNDVIKFPIEKLVENIFNTFKFTYIETNSLDIQRETVNHLVSNMHKFEAGKGKAFSYFSIIAKHYLIALNNNNWKRFNLNESIDIQTDEHSIDGIKSSVVNQLQFARQTLQEC